MILELLILVAIIIGIILIHMLPEWVATLLMIGSKRSAAHKRRAEQRVALWLAFCTTLFSACIVLAFVNEIVPSTPQTLVCGVLLLFISIALGIGALLQAFWKST